MFFAPILALVITLVLVTGLFFFSKNGINVYSASLLRSLFSKVTNADYFFLQKVHPIRLPGSLSTPHTEPKKSTIEYPKGILLMLFLLQGLMEEQKGLMSFKDKTIATSSL